MAAATLITGPNRGLGFEFASQYLADDGAYLPRHCLHECGVPWAEGFEGHRGAGASQGGAASRRARLARLSIVPQELFDTITVEVGPYQGLIMKNAGDNGVNFRKVGRDRIGITVDERTRPARLEAVWRAFGGHNLVYRDESPKYRLPAALIRQSAYLTHPVFHMNGGK